MRDDGTKSTAEEDARKKKSEENAAMKKADDDRAMKKADEESKASEITRQEALANNLSKPIYMLTKAGIQYLKAKRELANNLKVIYIPSIYYESGEALL